MLEKELAYFQQNQADIIKDHIGDFVVIHDEKVVGYFHTALEAYIENKEKFEEGTFLIQPCLIGESAYTAHYYSPVVPFS